MPRNRKAMMAPRAKFDVLNLLGVLLQEILILLQGKQLWTPLVSEASFGSEISDLPYILILSLCCNFLHVRFFFLGYQVVFSKLYSNFDRIICKLTVKTLIKHCVLRRLIWVCTACLCLIERTPGLHVY